MQCKVHRDNGEAFAADVWFSTYKENGASKLAAIIADVSEDYEAPSDTARLEGAERPRLNWPSSSGFAACFRRPREQRNCVPA